MTIKDAMKKFVVGSGGTTSLKSTTDLYDEINQVMGETINPLMALTIDTSIAADTDLLGKVIGDLQTGVHVYRDSFEGTLYYIDDYTGFSGDPTEQVGHYIALKMYVPGSDYEYEDGVRIKVQIRDRSTTLDSDGILILRIRNKHDAIRVTASKDGLESYSREFRLDRLNLAKAKPED